MAHLCLWHSSAIFEGWRESVAVAGECGVGRSGRVFLEEMFEERQRGFLLRFWPTRTRGARFAGFFRFSRQFEVERERNPEHVADRAQDAAEAGIFAQERNEVGVVEEVHQLGARAGDLVAGEEEKKPAFALADYAPWRYRLGI